MSTNNTYFSVAALKASLVAEGTAFLVQDPGAVTDGTFYWTLGDFTGRADNENILQSDNEPLSDGAWVRQGANSVSFTPAGTGAVPRSVQGKLSERLSPQDFGAVGDGVADDTAALQAFFDACTAAGVDTCVTKPLICKISGPLVITPANYLTPVGDHVSRNIDLANLTLRHSGDRNYVMLTIGRDPALGSAYRFRLGEIRLPHVEATGDLAWPGSLSGADTAIKLRNIWQSTIYEGHVYGFTKGIEFVGAQYLKVFGQEIIDCRYGRIWTTEGNTADLSFCNENRVAGGRISCTGLSNTLLQRYGDVLTWNRTTSYRGHNCNRFHDICYEIGTSEDDAALPVWIDGVGTNNSWDKCRHESGNGPFALVDGGGGTFGYANTFDVLYNRDSGSTGQQNIILQVNGACGNLYKGTGAAAFSWHSGDMAKLVSSSGGAGAYIKGREFFFLIGTDPTPADISRVDSVHTGAVTANRRGVQLAAGRNTRVGVAIDTSRIKDFLCAYDSPPGYTGRPQFFALDVNGALLSGNAPDSTYGNEPYVKGTPGINAPILVPDGKTFWPQGDSAQGRSLLVTVRDEVKTLLFTVGGGSNPAIVRAMSVTGYAAPNVPGSYYASFDGLGTLNVYSPVDDDGSEVLVSANPATAGKHGYYRQGQRVGNASAASGQPGGWVCTSSGWLCAAWMSGTAYAPSQIVTNDGGKIYECTTAGESAASGGPTGTTATWDGITDNGAKWRYIGTPAVFAAEASLT